MGILITASVADFRPAKNDHWSSKDAGRRATLLMTWRWLSPGGFGGPSLLRSQAVSPESPPAANRGAGERKLVRVISVSAPASHVYSKTSGRKSSTVLGPAVISMVSGAEARSPLLSPQVFSSSTWGVPGPLKATARRIVRLHVSRKAPRTRSSASGNGYSGSCAGVSDSATRAGVRSSTNSPRASPEKGWRTPATRDRSASLRERNSSPASRLRPSSSPPPSQTTLAWQFPPR